MSVMGVGTDLESYFAPSLVMFINSSALSPPPFVAMYAASFPPLVHQTLLESKPVYTFRLMFNSCSFWNETPNC